MCEEMSSGVMRNVVFLRSSSSGNGSEDQYSSKEKGVVELMGVSRWLCEATEMHWSDQVTDTGSAVGGMDSAMEPCSILNFNQEWESE